ncbi:MAG TPA: hypothetical protein VMU09_00825 [Acidimicrobiales bacterium]|nr:hypothetical protein [Acidimicrobiales bacterium]
MFIGALLFGGGFAGIALERSSHDACTAGLGSFGSMAGDAARNCGAHNLMFLGAIVTILVGVGLFVAAMLIRQ